MKAGNPPTLERPLKRALSAYSQDNIDWLIHTYVEGRKGWRAAAKLCDMHVETARYVLLKAGVMRTKTYIPPEDYTRLKGFLAQNKTSREIADITGWTVRRVRNLRENLRKKVYYAGVA